jgi:Trk K+ transport system NAD-binding subunit
MLDLRHEDLAIVELVIPDGSRAAGRLVSELDLPERARLISITHDDVYTIASGESRLHAGDRVMAILAPALREALERAVGT